MILGQCRPQDLTLPLERSHSFLGFGLFASMQHEAFQAQRGFSCRLCANVGDSPFEPVPQPPDFHQVALLQGGTHFREEVIRVLEEELDHLPEQIRLVETPLQSQLGIEDSDGWRTCRFCRGRSRRDCANISRCRLVTALLSADVDDRRTAESLLPLAVMGGDALDQRIDRLPVLQDPDLTGLLGVGRQHPAAEIGKPSAVFRRHELAEPLVDHHAAVQAQQGGPMPG